MELRDLRTEGRMTEEEHEGRMKAARRVAGWELGHDSWAGIIIAAYMNPSEAHRRMDDEESTS